MSWTASPIVRQGQPIQPIPQQPSLGVLGIGAALGYLLTRNLAGAALGAGVGLLLSQSGGLHAVPGVHGSPACLCARGTQNVPTAGNPGCNCQPVSG